MRKMDLHFTRTNGEADERIDGLMDFVGGVSHPEIVREMIIAALKAGQEDEEKADLKLMNATLKEMRFTSKIFGPYRNIRKVSVFGSARTSPDEQVYKTASEFGRRLSEEGYMVITGGGGGIMQAVNEGAGPLSSFGVNIRLPFEQKANPVLEGNPRLITYKYFFNRKVAFIKEADAVALFPGGFGTLDEAMEIITLVQTGKRNPIPLVLIDEPGGHYWKKWISFVEEELMSEGYVSRTDFHIFERVDSIERAVECISRFYSRFHSLRYVDRQLVIRLLKPLDPNAVRELKETFRDILYPEGGIELSGALAAEEDEPALMDMPRLLVDFNRKDFGRLRALIDMINAF